MKSKLFKNIINGFVIRLFILVFPGPVLITFGQQTSLTENDIITNAQALFDKKDYQAAIPLYAQLVSVHPDDPIFNYRFGVCTLFGDRKDKKKPIRYLNNAAQTIKDDQELFYYLGVAYHQNQEFANAMKYFNLYLSKIASNSPERAVVLEKVNACLNGLTLADKNLVAEIVSTSKFQKENFHRAYAAQDFNGSLMIKPEIFVSEKERKLCENSYVYLVHPSNVLYFSGYVDSENSNRDIFKVELTESGDWGIPEKAEEVINTSFDENYPVLVDNGTTLFFSSKGHNSLGGYDIFRSTLNPETNTFGPPENLGPGVNSPFDDVVFIPTKDKSYVYFASDRDNLNSSINVYKIKLIDNAFNDLELILAGNNAGLVTPSEEQSNISNSSSEKEAVNGKQDIAFEQNKTTEPLSDPSKKAASMVNDRTKSQALADSAFGIVTTTKNLIRDLTNKRDRANTISQRKADEAKTLEARFNESIELLANAVTEEQFLIDLEKSVKFKEEIYQLQQRSGHANKIAWNLGNQVKTKNQELESLKVQASKIQSASVSGTFEETLVLFSTYKKIVTATDTLVDYSDQLTAITNNKTTFTIPQTELAFADNLKKAFKNNTLVAEMNTSKPVFDEKAPIVVIDKTTKSQDSNSVNKPVQQIFEPFALVQPVVYSAPNFATDDPGSEVLSLDFNIDNRTQPIALVETILYNAQENELLVVENVEIEISFAIDQLPLIEVYPLVQPVYSNVLLTSIEPSETNLTLNFEIDAIEPEKLVLPVDYAFSSSDISVNEELEISDFTDKPEVKSSLALVEPVHMKDYLIQNSPDETSLELSFANDEITPENLIQPVEYVLSGQDIAMNEEIEISDFTDKPEVISSLALVEPIQMKDYSIQNSPDETSLELSFANDEITPENLIQPVEYVLSGQDIAMNEEIENSNFIDKPEVLNSAALVVPVHMKDYLTQNSLDETSLEISFAADELNPEKLVMPVEGNLVAQSLVKIDEEIEISNLKENAEQINIETLVQPVYATNLVLNGSQVEADLEIRFTVDQIKALQVVNQVPVNLIASNQIRIEEDLEVSDYSDETSAIEIADIIEPLTIQSVYSGPAFFEEDLEINFHADATTAYRLVEVIAYKENVSFDVANAEPQLDILPDQFEVDNLVNLVGNSSLSLNEIDPANENIELSYRIDLNSTPASDVSKMMTYEEPASLILQPALDKSTEAYTIVDPVLYAEAQINPLFSDEDLVISFIIDIKSDAKITTLNTENSNSSEIAINNTSAEPVKINMRDKLVASADEIYFLREAVLLANGIETSRSDDEILLKALNNPEELSYEELLYAANLTDVQEEKLAIYNVAFVHIDRDWRAFNNAAVSAIHIDDLGKANCFLYQASLLSVENGYIQNNMGILACHQSEYDKAEAYFVAASNLGYDAKYNLKLANGLADIANVTKLSDEEKIKNAEKSEDVIVDIIDYKTTEE